MKRTTIFLAALALVAASCTKTEVVSDKTQDSVKGIGFSAYTSRPTKTAQEDVTTEKLSSFQVTAIGNNAVYFDDVTFNKSNVWESDTKYFWPAYALTFCAYNTPTKGTFTRNITEEAQTLTFSPSTKLAEQEDLVVAYAENKKETDATDPYSSLPLTFKHYLTQVIVKAKNSSSTYTVTVDGVKLANFKNQGTYTFSTKEMVADDSKTNYTANFTKVTLNNTPQEVMTDANNGRWYLVPQSVTAWAQANESTNTSKGTYLALKVKITANNGALKIYPATGEDSAWMAIPVSSSEIGFVQGHKYTIAVNFFSTESGATSGGAGYVDPEEPGDLDGNASTNDAGKKIIGGVIKFNATVDDWSSNSHDITIEL